MNNFATTRLFIQILCMVISAITNTCGQEHSATNMDAVLHNITRTLLQLKSELNHVKTELKTQRKMNSEQEITIKQQNNKLKKLQDFCMKDIQCPDKLEETTYQYTVYGCAGDILPLVCTGGKTIQVILAEFGEYTDTCNDDCCVPNPTDCVENVAENNIADWVVLKVQCDNQTRCDYLFQSSTFIENCTVSEIVDYMTIYYTCLPEDDNPVVAFTAYTELTYEYEQGDVVVFDHTLTNIGGYYNPNISTFICPRHGLYQFSIFITAALNNTAQANIMLEGAQMVIAWADAVPNAFPQASNSVLVECFSGQKVWVESSSGSVNSVVANNAWKHSTFSGLLILTFE